MKQELINEDHRHQSQVFRALELLDINSRKALFAMFKEE